MEAQNPTTVVAHTDAKGNGSSPRCSRKDTRVDSGLSVAVRRIFLRGGGTSTNCHLY